MKCLAMNLKSISLSTSADPEWVSSNTTNTTNTTSTNNNSNNNNKQCVTTTMTSTHVAGTIEDASFNAMKTALIESIRAVLPVDAVALDLHGAGVAQSYTDIESEIGAMCSESHSPANTSRSLVTGVTTMVSSKLHMLTLHSHAHAQRTTFHMKRAHSRTQ